MKTVPPTLEMACEKLVRASIELKAQIEHAPETCISNARLLDFTNDVVGWCYFIKGYLHESELLSESKVRP